MNTTVKVFIVLFAATLGAIATHIDAIFIAPWAFFYLDSFLLDRLTERKQKANPDHNPYLIYMVEKDMYDILNSTISFYSDDTSRRAIDEVTGAPVYCTIDGKRDAVARLLPESVFLERGELYDDFNDAVVTGAVDGQVVARVVRKYHPRIPSEFWVDLQSFHDNNENWNKIGITKAGIENSELIKTKISNRVYF